MKICYVDESGTDGKSPLVVMVGVIADAQRLRRTQEEFSSAFDSVGEVAPAGLRELKGADLYGGKRLWRNVDGDTRHGVIDELCRWLVSRKHTVALAALDCKAVESSPCPATPDLWLASALHIALQAQRAHQKLKGGKGQTFLVFDENKSQLDALPELLFAPPPWTDDYYGKKKKSEGLDQILDTAFYAKSHHVGLVQIADLFAFILRRYAELVEYEFVEKYKGEQERISGWVELIGSRLLDPGDRWPKRPKSPCQRWFCDVAPSALRAL